MKNYIIIIILSIFLVFLIGYDTSSKSSNLIHLNNPSSNKQLLIAIYSGTDIVLDNFNLDGIYSLMHAYPKKDFQSLHSDLHKGFNNVLSININEYLQMEYTPNNPIIIIKDVKEADLHEILYFKPPNTALIITSLSKRINPLFIESNLSGLMHSSTTKKEGFIKYSDFIALINPRDDISIDYYLKESINPIYYLGQLYDINISLLYGRFILLAFMFILFLSFFISKKHPILISYILFLIPAFSFVFGISYFSNLNGIIKSILVIILSFVIGLLLYSFKISYKNIFICIWGFNILLLTYFTFSQKFLYQSPIGFNNIFYGTRFYGWNNDLIGILLGSLLSISYTINSNKIKYSFSLLIVSLFICILFFSPLYGANVGGMLCLFCSAILCTLILGEDFLIKYIAIGGYTLAFILLQKVFITWDLTQTSSTHWGVWIQSIKNMEFDFAIGILYIKIRQIILFLITPPLNILLFLQWILLLKPKNISLYDKRWRDIFLIMSLIIIFLNDSGVLSTIVMLIYFLIPFYIKNKVPLFFS
ncbi:MAG: hypothetical protein GX308_00565 [Epulopiscium sp.]|nr:hypothetical protein [Candidatus Epulonipiscium sp.]